MYRRVVKRPQTQEGWVEKKHDPTRRGLLRKATYAAPVVLTLQAMSSVAKAGSEKAGSEKEPLTKPKKPKKP
jgi:hypothetical protein